MNQSITFEEWQRVYRRVTDMAERINRMKTDRAFRMAKKAGIGADCLCIHNASIDDELKGWCARNPGRLKVAKQARRILEDWSASRIAERIERRAWQRVKR